MVDWFSQFGNTYKELSTSTIVNNKVILSVNSLDALTKFMFDPPTLSSVFGDPTRWVSNLYLYPFDLAYKNISTVGEKVLEINGDRPNIAIPCLDFYQYNANQMYNIGEIYCEPKTKNFADYNGYTKISLWVPFLGFIGLNPNDVMGKYINVRLSVDYNIGEGVYYISVSNTPIVYDFNNPDGFKTSETERILSTYKITLAYEIPLVYTNMAEIKRNIIMNSIKFAGGIVGGIAMGGVATSVGAVSSSSITTTTNTVRNPKSGRQIKAGTTTTETTRTKDSNRTSTPTTSSLFDSTPKSVDDMVLSVACDRVDNPALLVDGSDHLILVVYRPKIIKQKNTFNFLYGKPLGEVRRISSLKGYTEISSVHLEGVGFGQATESEIAEIEVELSRGVIL